MTTDDQVRVAGADPGAGGGAPPPRGKGGVLDLLSTLDQFLAV